MLLKNILRELRNQLSIVLGGSKNLQEVSQRTPTHTKQETWRTADSDVNPSLTF
jgi:hypothetical protein